MGDIVVGDVLLLWIEISSRFSAHQSHRNLPKIKTFSLVGTYLDNGHFLAILRFLGDQLHRHPVRQNTMELQHLTTIRKIRTIRTTLVSGWLSRFHIIFLVVFESLLFILPILCHGLLGCHSHFFLVFQYRRKLSLEGLGVYFQFSYRILDLCLYDCYHR